MITYKSNMENFNAKNYRDNLVKDLKEIKKTNPEKAREILSEAQESEEYKKAQEFGQEKYRNKKESNNVLTYEDKVELLRNLNISEIKNFDFSIPVIDKYCPKAKEYIYKKSHTDIREAILALTNKFSYEKFSQEDLESISKYGGVVFGDPDTDKVIKNGALVFKTAFPNYSFCKEDDEGRTVFVKSVCEVLDLELNVENLKNIFNKYRHERGAVNEPELEAILKKYASDNNLKLMGRTCNYVFELDQMPPFEDSGDKEYVISSELKLSFNYNGHNIEISNYAGFDNNWENYLQNHDNPAGLSRAGVRLKCKIDGEEYKEKTRSVFSSENSSKDINGFQSWRKWVGYPELI